MERDRQYYRLLCIDNKILSKIVIPLQIPTEGFFKEHICMLHFANISYVTKNENYKLNIIKEYNKTVFNILC